MRLLHHDHANGMTYYVFAVIEHASRRIRVLGATAHEDLLSAYRPTGAAAFGGDGLPWLTTW
jgi:hypothetical protein